MKERGNDKRKLNSYKETELPLDTEQNDEMDEVVSTIEQNCSQELDQLFEEGKKHELKLN